MKMMKTGGMKMSENLQVYEALKDVPPEALKEIKGGRLKGMSDINPMWRIKALTEQFGICGIGWKYETVRKWLEEGANGNVGAFVDINLYIKANGEWSEAIPGTGGSMFVTKESAGLHTSDECFKMALTDAIGVACKALGMAASVYWNKDRTKYTDSPPPATAKTGNETGKSQSDDALDVFDTPITDDDVPKETKKYASEAQKNFIDDLTEQRKIPSAGLEEILEERYGIKSKEELTTKEASDLIEFIKNGAQ